MRNVIFFDRDGTLIEDKIYLNDPEQVVYLPGVFEGLKKLRDFGYEFIIVTNQSGVPRGLVDHDNLMQIHKNIRTDFAKDGIDILNFYHAPFLVESNHHWRKPNPGMLEAGIKDFDVNISTAWMIGDRMTDVEAGHRAGMKSIFMHGTEEPKTDLYKEAEFNAQNFTEVSQFIIENTSHPLPN